MRLIRALVLLALLALVAAGAWLWRDYQRFAAAPLAIAAGEELLDVPLGTPFLRIVAELRKRGYTDAHPLYWRALAWQMGVADGLHAGEYALAYGLTPRSLLQRMARGEVVQHRFTIVEGWSVRELRAALAQEEALAHETLALSDEDLMARLGAPGVAAEGRFLPETYAYTRGRSDLELLKRAHVGLQETLARAWAGRDPGLPLATPDEALVLASIVEKETGKAAERPRIAGVFVRRLKLGMRLQTDPTVIYGIGSSFDGNLTRRHLETDTPFNTYTRFGLPPTPIALPGADAIAAVMHPAPGDDLYFVARGDGSHAFSPSLREHNAAVARYQLRRRNP
jgi:UPF0755 protein